ATAPRAGAEPDAQAHPLADATTDTQAHPATDTQAGAEPDAQAHAVTDTRAGAVADAHADAVAGGQALPRAHAVGGGGSDPVGLALRSAPGIAALFEAQARARGEAVAVVDGERSLDYATVDRR